LDVATHALQELSAANSHGLTNDTAQADELFERTWRAAYPALRSRAQRLVGGQTDQTDDLLGSAAIKALQFMRRSPQKLTDPEVFLFVVLRHVFLDAVRRRTRDNRLFGSPLALDDDMGVADMGSNHVPEDWNEHREQLQLVAAALQTMPRAQQRLFVLRFLDELPYSAIAERLEISEPLARKRVQLLRGRLMAALERDAIHALAPSALEPEHTMPDTSFQGCQTPSEPPVSDSPAKQHHPTKEHDMINWNAQFTQMIRKTNQAYWGNWSLSSEITPGAVGIVDPSTGLFKLIATAIPGVSDGNFLHNKVSSDWNAMTSDVSRTETDIDLKGEVTDPDTGITTKAGLQIQWKFGTEGSMVSKCALDAETVLNNPDAVLGQNIDWLVQRAGQSGMGSEGRIAQGFGVVTSVLYARSGLNVGSMAADNTFSLTGTAAGVHKLLGEASGKGSFTSTNESKSVDKHLWPSEAGVLPTGSVPLAFTFASFDGKLLLPRWITHISAYQLVIRNNHGGTYKVVINLKYDTPRGPKTNSTYATGGLTATIADIPLDASNLQLQLVFKGVSTDETHNLQWASPRGQWVNGVRHVDLYGVWPGQTRAVDVEAGLA
jgi:RNA polymerase sigma factor (sigma-70 family)